jgi:hypothetical protein
MLSITVPESISNTKSLQKIIDLAGNTSAEYTFSPDHNIEINSPLKVFNHTEFIGNGCQFILQDDAPISVFSNTTPLISPKYPLSTEGLIFHDLIIDGNRDNQAEVEEKYPKSWGNGFHNVFMLGSFGSVSYANAKDCLFYNIDYKNSLGDLIRVEGGSNIVAHDITASRGGHDVICFVVNQGEIYNIKADLEVNAGIRTRSSKNIKIHDCELDGSSGRAYAPGIIIQSTAANWTSSDIGVYENYIHDTYGPGIQVTGTVKNSGLVSIHNNLFYNCGNMPSSANRPTTGAIIYNGFPVKIQNNTIVNCSGYGVAAGNYDVSSIYSYESSISRNIITGTKRALKVGTASGSAIANLTTSKAPECSENCLYWNLSNLHKATQTGGILKDPKFIGPEDYHLQKDSPCRFSGYQLGCYSDEISVDLLLSCKVSQLENLKPLLPSDHQIYRKL